ncbi:MAG TPA: hypothetical protein PLK30_05860 [Blastocatellia bacterium]|nr:hypothetical protein [Blastocatellia bacterium]
MANVAIICHLERLWPAYETDQAYFGLNLSASFDQLAGTQAEALSLLMPWLWGNVERIHIWRKNSATLELANVVSYPVNDGEFDGAPIKNAILDEAKDIWANPADGSEAFVWRPTVGVEEEQESRRYFRNLLGYVSTLPAPAPQQLNLSLCFKLPAALLTAGDSILAVPEFKGETLGDIVPKATGPSSTISRSGVTDINIWGYEPGTHSVQAYVVPWKVVLTPDPSATSYIDFGSYWIKNSFESGQQQWFGSDWTVRLESKIAGIFDLAQRQIDAFRKNIGAISNPANFDDQAYMSVLRFFRQSVVATTRDLAGTGVQPGADGADVAGYLLSSCRDVGLESNGLMESFRLSMRGALEFYNRTQTYEDWRKLVESIPAVKATAAIRQPAEFRRRDRLDDELGELEAIQSALADENNLRNFLLTQWNLAANKTGSVTKTTITSAQASYFQSLRPGKGDTGLLGLNDGRAWVLTLANLNSARLVSGDKYFFRVTDPKLSPASQIALEVSRNADTLKIRLLDASEIEKAQAEFPISSDHHLRLKIARQAEKSWFVTAQFGTGANVWQPIGASDVQVATTSKLDAAAIVVDLNVGVGPLSFTQPSVLVAPADKIAAAISDWDRWSFNKAQTFYSRFSTSLKDSILPAIQLRQRLASGNIGRIWSDLINIKHSAGNEFKQLTDNLKQKLKDYFSKRISGIAEYADYLPLPSGAVPVPPVKTTIETWMNTSLDAFAEGFAPLLLPMLDNPTEEGDSSPTEISQGVTIQVDRLAKFAEGNDDDAQDFLRRIAGIGLLMRQSQTTGQAPWRCLNMAELRAETATSDLDERLKLVFPKALAPYRMTYQNDLRQALLTYNDNPLIAKSPAAKLSGGVSLENQLGDDIAGRIEYTPANKNTNWAKLPPLKFGQTYELAAFVIGNSGALPKELSDGHPAKLRDWTETFQPDFSSAVSSPVRRVKYLRRVRVGKPRFSVAGEIGQIGKLRIQLPRIPDQVFPLAGELKLNPASISGIPLPDPSEDMTFKGADPVVNAGAQNLPLLLLPSLKTTNPTEFSFGLRKPATDLATWNRWLAKDQDAETGPDKPTEEKRKQVWADYHRKAPKDPSRASDDNRDDISLDDPAAENFFVAELVMMRPTAAVAKTVKVDIPPPQATGGIGLAQSLPTTVLCKHGEVSEITATGSKLVVTIGKGEVAELRIYVPVKAQWFDDDNLRRFHKLPPPTKGAWQKFENTYYLFSPLRMLLEGATTDLPTPEEVWNAIRPVAVGGRLTVHLDRGAAGSANKFDYVATVELRRQLWRWQGRPLREFPARTNDKQPEINKLPLNTDSPATNAFLWDAEGFGDRGDDDYMLTSASLSTLDNSPLLFEDDRTQDRRALYYRFAVRANTRYSGLLEILQKNAPEFVDSSRNATSPGTTDPQNPRDNWKRYLVNCRWQEEVPKPQVKFVVPLTEAASTTEANKARLPGLLVVLNESWYEVGGLAETLVAEMQEADSPTGGAKLPEFGPDPILTGDAWTGGKVKMNVSQPLGHTFDTDADAPLFVASSCLLSFPELPKNLEDKWSFAKLVFKRNLIVNGNPAALESKPTDPYWVQLLPDFSEFGQNFDYNSLRLRRSASNPNFVEILTNGVPATLPADPPLAGFNQFSRWLVLTQVIRDMRGRRDQERYVGLYKLGAQGICQPLDEQTRIGNDWKLRGRIIEVQYRVEALGNLRSEANYYSGAKLDGGRQWAVTLNSIKANFTTSGGYSVSLNQSANGAKLVSIAALHNANGSVTLQLKNSGGTVVQETTIPSAQVSAPYAVRLVLTKSGNSWEVSAQHRSATDWVQFGTTTLNALPEVAINVALSQTASKAQELSYISPSLTSEPWDHLFPLELPGTTPEDAKARIVRVSRPIEM